MRLKRVFVSVLSPLSLKSYGGSQIQIADHPNCPQLAWPFMAWLCCCLLEGCGGNWCIWLVKDESGPNNFHLRSPALPLTLTSSSGSPLPDTTTRGSSACPLYCSSWNRGQCLWPFGDCRFHHSCSLCNGDHPRVPFHSHGTICSRSPSPISRGRPWKGTDALNVSCT